MMKRYALAFWAFSSAWSATAFAGFNEALHNCINQAAVTRGHQCNKKEEVDLILNSIGDTCKRVAILACSGTNAKELFTELVPMQDPVTQTMSNKEVRQTIYFGEGSDYLGASSQCWHTLNDSQSKPVDNVYQCQLMIDIKPRLLGYLK